MLLLLLLAAVADGQFRKLFCGLTAGPDGARWVSRWCRRILALIGLTLTVDGALPTPGANGLAVVSNHLSYLDILLFASVQPSIMVAKSEVRSWPLIGWITAQAGTVYVERADVLGGRRQTHAQVNARMAEAFRSGLPVVFFPEGTTTNGIGILPFRRGLFHSVLAGRVPVHTASLQYHLDLHKNPHATLADDVCYWGDMQFLPHLFKALGLKNLQAHLSFHPTPIPGHDRFELAAGARDQILRTLTPSPQPPSPAR